MQCRQIVFQTSVLSECDAPKVLNENPCSEYDAIKVFNENPWSDVVWDDEECEIITPIVQLAVNEELEQSDENMADRMQCKQDANNGVFDELSSKVVWDDELLQGVESQDSLLDLVVHGEYSVGMDSKPMAEPISWKASVETKDVSGELFGERTAWDEDPQHDAKPLDDNLQQLLWGDVSLYVAHVVEPLTKDFRCFPVSDAPTLSWRRPWMLLLRRRPTLRRSSSSLHSAAKAQRTQQYILVYFSNWPGAERPLILKWDKLSWSVKSFSPMFAAQLSAFILTCSLVT